MKIYKFKDNVDGRFAFIVAQTLDDAEKTLRNLTSIPFTLVESKPIEELNSPVVLVNHIMPF